jgi:hypothetical protein
MMKVVIVVQNLIKRRYTMKNDKLNTVTGNPLEPQGGRYCNLENRKCKKHGKVTSDDGGYICLYCGGRVSKWLPVANVISSQNK